MTVILSATEHDYYAFPLPIVVWSWAKIGVKSVVFVPSGDNPKLDLAIRYCGNNANFYKFDAEEKRIPTFSQVSRLFGAAIPGVDFEETIIVGDSDLCVFGDFFNNLNDGGIHIVGSDLTPKDQYPMCFICMKAKDWIEVMGINKTYQEHISELINPIEGLNIRGEQWCYDQWYAKKRIDASSKSNIVFHNRARPGTQFADNRYDRDDAFLLDRLSLDTIDYHMPRPGYESNNFYQILTVLNYHYPNDDFSWLVEYNEKYKQLL